MRRAWLLLAALVAAMTLAAPASAGGWASVRLDEPPGDLVAGTAWKTGLMVKQHDIHAISVDRVRARATHRESGQTITADAVADGTVGHYALEMTFPEPGSWKWTVTPDPFPPVAMATLNVVTAGSEAAATDATAGYTVHLYGQTCAERTPHVTLLGRIDLPATKSDEFVGGALPELERDWVSGLKRPVAVALERDGGVVACGETELLGARQLVVVALQPGDGSSVAGLVVFEQRGTRVWVRAYVTEGAEPAPAEATIRVNGMGTMATFVPPLLTVAAGTTVTWVNEGDIAHTITGKNTAFDDSGMLDPGASFSQTFDEPGTYAYVCDPHPGMAGTIVVE